MVFTLTYTMNPDYNEFRYNKQNTGACLQRAWLLRSIHWVPLTTSLVTMNNTPWLVRAIQWIPPNESTHNEEYTESCLQRVQLQWTIHWVPLTINLVTMNTLFVNKCFGLTSRRLCWESSLTVTITFLITLCYHLPCWQQCLQEEEHFNRN